MIRLLPVRITNVPLFFINTEILIPRILRRRGIGTYLLSVLVLILVFVLLESFLEHWRLPGYTDRMALHVSKSFFYVLFITAVGAGRAGHPPPVGTDALHALRIRGRADSTGERTGLPEKSCGITEDPFRGGRGDPADKDRSSGIGLRNVRRRLELLHSGNHRLDIREADGWFVIHLHLHFQSA